MKTIFLLLLAFITVTPQEADIHRYVQEIDKGLPENALKALPGLKKSYPLNPSVIYLDALLSTDGKDAFDKYKTIYEKFPHSEYADASMYNIYTYLYSTGNYISAGKILKEFKELYPDSPYRKAAEEMEGPFSEQEIVKKAMPESTAVVSSVSTFTIQAGAFLSLANAQRLKRNFEGAGYQSEIKEKIIGGSTFNVVYTGKFKTEKEASNILSEIKDKFNIEGRIIPAQ